VSERKTVPQAADLIEQLGALLDGVAISAPTSAPATESYDPASDDSMVEWAEHELGLKLRSVPKLLAPYLEAIQAFRARRMLRMALLGPRGGGKTMLDALIEVAAWRWFGGDWTNVAGSEKQATECYSYIRLWIARSPDLERHTRSTLLSLTTSIEGGKIVVCAASEKSVRGPHPRGPSGLGGMTVDEEALVERRIYIAATDQMGAADPSAIVRSGTLGPATGTWWELLQDPKKQGYDLHRWTAFEVAKRCPYDCATTCPVPEHFARDFHVRVGERDEFVHAAYCGGKAHDVDGWVSIDYLAQRFGEVDRESFEREYLGRGAAERAGKVYDPALLDAAVIREDLTFSRTGSLDEHEHRFIALEKKAGLDWGYAGQTAICYGVRLRDEIVIYRWATYTQQRFSLVRRDVVQWCEQDECGEVWPDAANPSDNAELAADGDRLADRTGGRLGVAVSPVVFSRDKAFGIGEVRRRLEQGKLRFATSFGGRPVEGWERALEYLKAYSMDEQGRPIKRDDHVPDSLLCLCIGFAEQIAPKPAKR
jgi:hypothetical protein